MKPLAFGCICWFHCYMAHATFLFEFLELKLVIENTVLVCVLIIHAYFLNDARITYR